MQIAGDDSSKQELIAHLVYFNDASTKAALTERSSDHGLTLLGQAVAWGFQETAIILAAGCRCVRAHHASVGDAFALHSAATASMTMLSTGLTSCVRVMLESGPQQTLDACLCSMREGVGGI